MTVNAPKIEHIFLSALNSESRRRSSSRSSNPQGATMSTRILTLCAWCGPATVVIALTGGLIAGVLPIPLGPESSVDHVVNFYGHDTRVITGLVISTLGVCFVFPLIALIAVFMMRMEGRTPILTFRSEEHTSELQSR